MKKASRHTGKKPLAPAYPPPGAIRVNFEKLRSMSWCPDPFREYYVALPIVCKDCGTQEVWTARQQQWWYEVAQGAIETTAVRCRACRRAMRERDAKVKQGAREARLARGQIQAAELSRKLSAERPEAFDWLQKPIQHLHLRNRTEKALLEQGFSAIGELVACDPAVCPSQLSSGDWEELKRTFKGFGIPIIGARIVPPRTS
jgi:hypothetical protein